MKPKIMIAQEDVEPLLCGRCKALVRRWLKDAPARRREKKAVYLHNRREARKKQGLCPDCGQPTSHGILCAECRAAANETRRRLFGQKPWRKGGRGRPPLSAVL